MATKTKEYKERTKLESKADRREKKFGFVHQEFGKKFAKREEREIFTLRKMQSQPR